MAVRFDEWYRSSPTRLTGPKCGHIFDTRLCCDGREHYYPCILAGCNERQYFCKHLRDDRHCPRAAHNTNDG
jgi:hypothetical protein